MTVGQQHLVYLGGTYGRNQWRASFIMDALARGIDDNRSFYNPADHTTLKRKDADDEAKRYATVVIHYLSDPKQDGNTVAADCLVEATMALYDDPERTIVVFDVGSMSGFGLRHMNHIQALLRERFPNAKIFSRDQTLSWLVANLVAP